MNKQKAKRARRILRHARVRSVVKGTKEAPRLSVSRSLNYVRLQLIDDTAKKTIVAAMSSDSLKIKDNPFVGKTGEAYAAGWTLGKAAIEKGIEKIAFDRGGFAYHGRVKAVAEGARAAGLKF